jgi:hypothetical protein
MIKVGWNGAIRGDSADGNRQHAQDEADQKFPNG